MRRVLAAAVITVALQASVMAQTAAGSSGCTVITRAAADGIAGGLLFSCGDISTKLATQGGARTAFVVVAIFGYLLGTSLLQIGYQRGAATCRRIVLFLLSVGESGRSCIRIGFRIANLGLRRLQCRESIDQLRSKFVG